MRGIVKRYPRVVASDHVDLEVRSGEIHAVIGENGAGKSTLMKILYGLVPPDAGEIRLHGERLAGHRPAAAIRLGLGMVHQHFMLIDTLTVAENVVLGMEPVRAGVFTDGTAAAEKVAALSAEYGLELDPNELIENLSVGLEQRVEIVKVLYRGAETLILDEPTGVLTPQEVRELFAILRSLRESGRTIVFITHKLDEVLDLADRITVMRDGRVTGVVDASGTTKEELARMMVGRDVLLEVERTPATPGENVLSVEHLSACGRKGTVVLDDVSLDIRAGEVLGVAGVQGNGQTELVEILTGLRRASGGRVLLRGNDVCGLAPRAIRALGVAHIPEDRQARGLVLEFSIAENLILGRQRSEAYSSKGMLRLGEMHDDAQRLIGENDLRPDDPGCVATHMSGGNQQKLIVAREFDEKPALLIASQPTRGVDIGAIEFVHKSLLRMRDAGAAVLLVSAELSEIMTLSDRVVVMLDGRVVAEYKGGGVTEEELGLSMTGGGPASDVAPAEESVS